MLSPDQRVCFVGDSFVQGTMDEACLGWAGRVCAAARGAGFELTGYNLGVRRDTSDDVRRRWLTECEARLPEGLEAAGVVFAFGTNDTTAAFCVARQLARAASSGTGAWRHLT